MGALDNFEEYLHTTISKLEDTAQPYIDKANQVDSLIVTVAMTRLGYRVILKAVHWVVHKIRRKKDDM